MKLYDYRRRQTGIDPIKVADDFVPITVDSPPADVFPEGHCKCIRCISDGTLTVVTAAGNSRTTTMRAGEYLMCSIRTVTNIASGSYEAFY